MLGYDDIPKQSADDVFEIYLKNSFLMLHYRETVSKAVNYFVDVWKSWVGHFLHPG